MSVMASDQAKRNLFFYGILAVTLMPLLGMPLLATLEFPFNQSLLIGLLIFAGGVGHVASTACLYADKSVRQFMAPIKWRFYALPAACLIATGCAIYFGASLEISQAIIAGLFMIHLAWLHFHYQRQNYGLVAFTAASTGNRVPKSFSNILLLPALAGVLAITPPLVGNAMHDEDYLAAAQNIMYVVACVIYAIGAALLVRLLASNRTAFSHPRIALMTAAAFLFFLPAIVISDSDYAFWSYAMAHGFQYLPMVFTVAGGAKPSWKVAITFVISVVIGGFALHRLAGNQALFLSGILLTWVHFILDARIWRMTNPDSRKLLRERFEFLFA
ncbi:MAG: hypothetical protein AAF539_07995 [Planctomycetota bacterium]